MATVAKAQFSLSCSMLNKKSPGMASQALGSMQDAPQDAGSMPKFVISAKFSGPTAKAQGGQDKEHSAGFLAPGGGKKFLLSGGPAGMRLAEQGGEWI